MYQDTETYHNKKSDKGSNRTVENADIVTHCFSATQIMLLKKTESLKYFLSKQAASTVVTKKVCSSEQRQQEDDALGNSSRTQQTSALS